MPKERISLLPRRRSLGASVHGTAARARFAPSGLQVVDVLVDRGYHPDAIIARAGLPLRLLFRRIDVDACSERVVFSSPHIDRRLAMTGATMIELPAQPPGEVRFTCGMGRYRGRIELVADRAPSPLQRFRVWALGRSTEAT
jgi:plastocyanin domain-containing protein